MSVEVSDLCCVNSRCSDAGKRGEGNLRFVRWTGKQKDIRFVRCRTCREEFSERKGTPLFKARLPRQEIFSIVEHLSEGDGIRKTARLTSHSKDTVLSWMRKSGAHARDFHDQKAQHLNVPELQLDEKWAFVGKKRSPPDAGGGRHRSPGR